MTRTQSEHPKKHVNLVKSKRKNGVVYILEVTSVYDPKIKNSRKIKSRIVGKLPPGETDNSKMIPTDKFYSRSKKKASGVADIAPAVATLQDSRDAFHITYPLDIVLLVVILAAINGHKSNYEVAEFWQVNRPVFEKWVPDFPTQDISHDTVRRLIMMIGRENSEALITRFTQPLLGELRERVVAVDGQACRTAAKASDEPRYILNVYDSDNLMCLEQELIGPKENEITRASGLVSQLDIHGAVVTCDALNTQVKFVQTVLDKGADYCFAVKENQGNTYEEIKGWFATNTAKTLTKSETTTDTAHGRHEVRTVRVLPANLNKLDKQMTNKWPGLEEGCIVEITSERTSEKTGETSTFVRYYITSLNYDKRYIAERLMRIIRQHWRIENSLHWVLDVTYDQDRTQCLNADYIKGKTLLNKIGYNWISALQSIEEETTGKKASSRPVWKVRMGNVDSALRQISALYRRSN